MKTCVVTYANDLNHKGLKRLEASLMHWWPGEVFSVVGKEWKGFGYRLKRVLVEADELRKDGFTHLIHVDAYDVVATGPPQDLAPALAHYGNPPLLIAAEGGCWPDGDRVKDYPDRKQLWWYPHSQFVLDLTQPVPKGFGELKDTDDDQRHLHDMVISKTPGIVMDLECRVLQSIAFAHPWNQYFEVKDGRVYNRITNSWPCFMHGNGQTTMDWIPGCGGA